jgi:exodeoxyribonuclease-3
MKLASWNVNSINLRKEKVLNWITSQNIDVLGLQEIKCEEDKFPKEFFQEKNFHVEIIGQKSYNGVAIISKYPIRVLNKHLPEFTEEIPQARYLEVEIQGCIFCSIYVPNGNPLNSEKFEYKIKWLDAFILHAKKLLEFEIPVILAGDFNIIPEEIDCWDENVWQNDALATPEIRKKFRIIKNLGFFDSYRLVNKNKIEWSFWDYQNGSWNKDHGIRIDHLLVNSFGADKIKDCQIDRSLRGKNKPSDHTPIFASF